MIQILNPQKEALLARIDQCQGSVYLALSDGTFCDLTHDPMARNLLRTLEIPRMGICLRVSDSRDVLGFLRDMMEARASRPAGNAGG